MSAEPDDFVELQPAVESKGFTPRAVAQGQTLATQIQQQIPADKITPELISAINSVMQSTPLIAETKASAGLKYKFLSEKEIIPAIRPHLITNGLVVFPYRILSTTESRQGKMIYRTQVTVFMIAHRGGGYTFATTVGEGFDSGDKACYKAMTGAYKYALREVFALSGGEDPDDTPSGGNPPGRVVSKEQAQKEALVAENAKMRVVRDCLTYAEDLKTLEETRSRYLKMPISNPTWKEAFDAAYERRKSELQPQSPQQSEQGDQENYL